MLLKISEISLPKFTQYRQEHVATKSGIVSKHLICKCQRKWYPTYTVTEVKILP